MILQNKTYDVLKIIALIIMPFADFIAALANIWGIPYGSQIVATLVALHALLAAFVKVSSDKYHEDKLKDDFTD